MTKHAEDEPLALSLSQLHESILDLIPECLLVFEKDYRVSFANRRARELSGMDPVAEGRRCFEVFHKRSSPCQGLRDPCPMHQTLTQKAPTAVMHLHLDAEGNEHQVEVQTLPLVNDKGEVLRVLEILRDHTAQSQFAKTLQEAETSFRRLFENANDGVVIRTAHGRILDANPAFCAMLGYPREELQSMKVADLVKQDNQERHAAQLQQARVHGSLRAEGKMICQDGHEIDIEVSSAAVDEECSLFQSVIRDVTERKRADQELKKKIDELSEFNRLAVGRELSMIKLKEEINRLLQALGESPKYDIVS